jgi:hypothetical protein
VTADRERDERMSDERFAELVESIHEAGQVRRGERDPARAYVVVELRAPDDDMTAALQREATNPAHTSADRELFAMAAAADTTLRAVGREWEALAVARLAHRLREVLTTPET